MNLTNQDFMYLHQCSMQWGERWRAKDGRFEPPVKSYEWRWAYWFDSTPALLLGRQFLQDNGWEFEVVWDLGMPEQWLLLTNYESIESKGDEVEEDQKRSCIGSTMAQGAGEGAGRGQIIGRSHQRLLEGVCQMTTQEKLDIQTLLEWHLKQLHQAEEEGNKTLTAFHDTASTLLAGLVK